MKWIVLTSLLWVFSTLVSCKDADAQSTYEAIDVTDELIQVKGANYVFRNEGLLSFSRFSEATLNSPVSEAMFNADKARTNSGIRLFIKSNSPKLRLTFKALNGINRGAEFAVYQNNSRSDVFTFKGDKARAEMVLEINNQQGDEASLFEITMPSLANVGLVKLELIKGASLLSVQKEEKPVYLAIGNSITHGVGQGSATFLTYPYLLAKSKDWDYYNLAVGGAKISPAIARMTAEMPPADVITILIGYNDLMFNDKSVEEYSKAYMDYLKMIRHNQVGAHIYCITLTHTRAVGNERTGLKPEGYRKALKHLVYQLQSEGDNKLHLIEGDKITSEANLRPEVLSDKVHFGIEGAALFAKELEQLVKKAE
ncbi:MAG: SGNH/GDSL hydrolase family protein [Bacteroidales bacterium]|nr:SGNH/GDSL hydrolase family protein [Bacteroidales bacterium]